MIGQWAWLELSQDLQPGECPESEYYGRNGYVTDGNSISRWWIDGDVLVRETLVTVGGEAVGRIYVHRFRRTGPGELNFEGNGSPQKLVRCGDVPREWEYRPDR